MNWHLSEICSVLGLYPVTNDPLFCIHSIETDSRQVVPGCLFVALKGEHFDGHDFLVKAIDQGAAACLVDSSCLVKDLPVPILKVDDTLKALGVLARAWLSHHPDVFKIALTGSNGKTTLKEMLASILNEAYGRDKVCVTQGNFNNEIGVPKTIFNIRSHHRYAVIEMGMNHFGEISRLTHMVQPDVAIINNAMRAHLGGGFQDVGDIAKAKGEILECLSPVGWAVLPQDSPFFEFWRAQLIETQTCLSFGLTEGIVHATGISLGTSESVFQANDGIDYTIHLLGEHNVRNALAALAVARGILDISGNVIQQAFLNLKSVPGRLNIHVLSDYVIIDDTYNANPDSMKAALDVLRTYPGSSCFIMGDIGELGEYSEELHQEVGTYAASLGIDAIWSLGQDSRCASSAFGGGGCHFESLDFLLKHIDDHASSFQTILIKGSRFMRMEQVVNYFLNRFEG
jgi:UDP-N-acetylmuramoyl-tripeptide--D-alanyl-D-alanine ligase